MEATPPFLSVIIPAYNRENFVGEAIRSALEQTRPPGEIIVVDDGSTDRTGEIARSFGGIIRCVTQENQGASMARNAGVAASRGELLAFLDSDDLWLPQKLEWQIGHLDLHPETDMVFGHMQPFISPELEATYDREIDTSIIPAICSSTLLVRKKAFERIGLFHREKLAAEFIDWYSRAQDLGCTSFTLPQLVMRRRAHLTNIVQDRVRMKSEYTHVLKSILDRRRAAQPSQ